LFSEPSLVEYTEEEIRSSQWSMNEFRAVDYSADHRSSESYVISTQKNDRINTIRNMNTYHNKEQSKVEFDKPKSLARVDSGSDIASPRAETTPPKSNHKKIQQRANYEEAYDHAYKPMQRTPIQNNKKIEKKEDEPEVEMVPFKSYNLYDHKDNIDLTDDNFKEQRTPKNDSNSQRRKRSNNYEEDPYMSKENQHTNINKNMADEVRQQLRDHGGGNQNSKQLSKSRTEKTQLGFGSHTPDPDSRTPKRSHFANKRSKISIASGLDYATNTNVPISHPSSFDAGYGAQNHSYHPQFTSHFYHTQNPHHPQTVNVFDHPSNSFISNQRPDDNFNGWTHQLQEGSKTIAKQDELIYSLRNEMRKLQDCVIQKDSVINMRNLEAVRYRETIEMLQFDLDRLRAEHQNTGQDTPRVQNENKIIRDQVKKLLDEAKDRSHDISRLKKLINMYDIQLEELEHKMTMMKNKEIKLEAEIEQTNETVRHEETKYRHLKMDYDELKFQMGRNKILSSDVVKLDDFKFRPNSYNIDYTKQYNSSRPEPYRPLTTQQTPKPEPTKEIVPVVNAFSDKLYQKNMASTVGDLLRWDSTKGVFSDRKRWPNRDAQGNGRSISSPPATNAGRAQLDYD